MIIKSPSTAQATGDRRPHGKTTFLPNRLRARSSADASRYRQILDALPVAIYSTDANGRITHFNTAAVELSGRTPELGSDRWCVSWKLFHLDGTPMPHEQCPMAVTLREGRAVRGETAILERPDGTRAWFMPYPTPWFDEEGRVIGGINMLVNVTERVRNEEKIRASEARLISNAQTLGKLNEFASRLSLASTLRAEMERPASEADLRRSEERFRGFASATSDFVYCMNPDWTEMLKLQGREFVGDAPGAGRLWLERCVHPDDQASVRKIIREAIRTRSNVELEYRVIRDDGSTGWTQSRAIPLLADDGQIIEWIGTASDVTHRKASEEGLRLREMIMAGQREALEAAINNAPLETSLGVLVRTATDVVGQDVRAGFYLANADRTKLRHIVGMSTEYAQAVEDFTVGPDSLACGLATYTGKPVLTADVKVDPLWQPWLWMAEQFDYRACWSFPIQSARDSFFGTLAVYSRQPREATARDVEFCGLLTNTASLIISRHEEMQARKQIERTLRVSEERHRQTLSLMPAAVYSCDATGAITYFNPQAEHLWGRAPKLGDRDERFCGSARLILPDGKTLPHDECPMAIALREGRSFRDTAVKIGRPDGSLIEVSVNIDPVLNEQGEVVGAINAFHDVSALKRAEQALKEADRRKDEFLATLAHELRNPLAPMRNSLHILRSAGDDPKTVCRIRDIMDRQVNHMVRLVDDLMEVSRITRGKIELRRERVDLAAIVKSAVETSGPFVQAAGHQLTITLPPESLVLEGDPVRLAQVFTNLLNNAAKYTKKAGRISLTVRRDASCAIVSVRDTGIGIPATMLSRIFDLFTQVNSGNGRAQGGLGIGLTLVRNLVSLHGGTIEAKSAGPDLGSEFVVRLPLVDRRAVGSDEHQGDPPLLDLNVHRFLVVDDNDDASESLAMMLRFMGADVRTADNGADALRALETYRPTVVLLDIGMPGMDGLEVARRARRQLAGQKVILVALTGWGQVEDLRRSREAGFDHHLVKPLDLGALRELLESH